MGPSGVGFDGWVGSSSSSSDGDEDVEPEEAAKCIVEEEVFSHNSIYSVV